MSKISLSDIANLQNENSAVSTMAANNDIIETAFDNTLSRDGTTPNQMGADLDMNSNRVMNLPAPQADLDAVRKSDLDAAVIGTYSTPTVLGTANQITVSTVGLTNTVSLPNALTFTGKTVTGGTFAGPTLTTPALGTPTAGVLTSCTGLPISTGVSGLGTGVATALAVNVGSAGAFTTFNGALGTPSSGTLTNCTGLPIANTTGNIPVTRLNSGTSAGATTFWRGDTTWSTAVTSVTLGAGYGITVSGTNPVTTSGTHTATVGLTSLSAAAAADVAVNSATYTVGAQVAQGSTGTWLVTANVAFIDSGTAMTLSVRLTDGTTAFASGAATSGAATFIGHVSLSGIVTSPAGNIRVEAKNASGSNCKMLFNQSGNGFDTAIRVVRIA